ncbi:chorismate--pyruvate lyase family protein [Shewanella sp. GXUN23E]|uniref:chorismate--pyruvate lyase family protein n=1 Tax=Shewanella sp. GXUN23E TaxID=3422498 RepID=UPI003D7EA94E
MDVTRFSFPYGESIQWFSPAKAENLPPQPLWDWLVSKDSLTAKLKAHCHDFSVLLVDEQWHHGLSNRYWTREVLLLLDDTPWVFASTLIPESLMQNPEAGLQNLGNRPLGELLYSSKNYLPGNIEVARFESCSRLNELSCKLHQPVTEPLWGRRRYFEFQQQTLIVSEVFLPQAISTITQRQTPDLSGK